VQFSLPRRHPLVGGHQPAADIMRTLALALEAQEGDGRAAQLQGLMPLPELAGVPLEQIAVEGLLY